MSEHNRWLLPQGIEELLPEAATALEGLRRRLLDGFSGWGYELLIPPMIEYLDTLFAATGQDLDLRTFKLTDQLSGRLMGVRADMTPQVARIDAHTLKREGVARLCYIGSTLHTLPDDFGGSRAPIQVGAELYGCDHTAADVEILRLMCHTLAAAGLKQPHIDLGHVGIYRALVAQAGLRGADEANLFDALQRKARAEIASQLAQLDCAAEVKAMLAELPDLYGGIETLDRARGVLAAAGEAVAAALDNLQEIVDGFQALEPDLDLHFDLGELRCYRYETGVVFAAYTPGVGQEIARGGRYDGIGHVYGRARPATGFSADLKQLLALMPTGAESRRAPIWAPLPMDEELEAKVEALRSEGERVVYELPGESAVQAGCDRRLVRRGSAWQVEPLG